MKKYKYSYNILPNTNDERFEEICKKIENSFDGLVKEKLLEDVDLSSYQHYIFQGKEIAVCNDYYVGALYIDSDIDLSELFGEFLYTPKQ